MKVSRMNIGDYGKLKAFFDLEVDGFTIKGFKIVDGANGLFVSMPSQKNEEGEWNDTVWASKETRSKVNEVAISHYNNESNPTIRKKNGSMSDVAYEKEQQYDGSEGVDLKKDMDNKIPF